jgi:anti-sigma factor RsiW
MPVSECAEVELLLQADLDGELDVPGSALAAAHIARCPACASRQADLADLSVRLRAGLQYHPASAGLRQSVENLVRSVEQTAAPRRANGRPFMGARAWLQQASGWLRPAFPIGAGAALAAAVLVMLMPTTPELPDSVVASHIRALQPGHLMDVASTDQHTVKPWFDGKLDYAPPVKDLAAQGFPLIGGRLDYLNGRPVAALAFRRAQHIIDLYVWPSGGRFAAPSGSGERSGYNYDRWTEDGMEFWAVSDLAAPDLEQFAERWRRAP